MSDSVLDPRDRTSVTWLKLKKYLEDRLASLRARNDGPHDAEKTAFIRGQIAEVKRLIGLDSDAPPMQEDAERFKNLD